MIWNKKVIKNRKLKYIKKYIKILNLVITQSTQSTEFKTQRVILWKTDSVYVYLSGDSTNILSLCIHTNLFVQKLILKLLHVSAKVNKAILLKSYLLFINCVLKSCLLCFKAYLQCPCTFEMQYKKHHSS